MPAPAAPPPCFIPVIQLLRHPLTATPLPPNYTTVNKHTQVCCAAALRDGAVRAVPVRYVLLRGVLREYLRAASMLPFIGITRLVCQIWL